MPEVRPIETPSVDSLLGRIGNTPLVDLSELLGLRPGVQILAKCEWFNPGGSVKDRAALSMVRDAFERSGFTNAVGADAFFLRIHVACHQAGRRMNSYLVGEVDSPG